MAACHSVLWVWDPLHLILCQLFLFLSRRVGPCLFFAGKEREVVSTTFPRAVSDWLTRNHNVPTDNNASLPRQMYQRGGLYLFRRKTAVYSTTTDYREWAAQGVSLCTLFSHPYILFSRSRTPPGVIPTGATFGGGRSKIGLGGAVFLFRVFGWKE